MKDHVKFVFAECNVIHPNDGWHPFCGAQRSKGMVYQRFSPTMGAINLVDEHPEVVERLAGELKAWKEKAAAARLTPDSELEKKLDSEDLKRLRSLGYLK